MNLYVLFCLPKKNQKKQSRIKLPIGGGGIQLSPGTTRVKNIGTLFIPPINNCKTIAEVTAVTKLHQGTKKGTGCYRSFLDFPLVTFFSARKKK